jgi:hypothetical protein
MQMSARQDLFVSTAVLALLSAGLIGCSAKPQQQRDLACTIAASTDTAGWQRVGTKPRFLLPPGFAVDPSVIHMHGGTTWKRGSATIAHASGHWGPGSFGDPATSPGYSRFSDCHTFVHGRIAQIVVYQQRNGDAGASLWFVGQTELVTGAGWKWADLPVLMRVLRSADVDQ